jgi:hypothetical protein
MSSDRSYGKTEFHDVTIRSTDPHSAYRPLEQQYRNVRILDADPVAKKKCKFYRWLCDIFSEDEKPSNSHFL